MQKVLGVAQLDLTCVPDDPDRPEDRAAAEFCQWAVTRRLKYGVWGLVWSILSSVLPEGRGLCEPVWPPLGRLERRGKWAGKRALAAVKAKPPGSYELEHDDFRNVTGVKFKGAGGHEVTEDPSRFLIFTHLSLYEDPSGWNDLESSYRAFAAKDAAIKLHQAYLSRLVGPFLKATSADTQNAALHAQLESARACGYVVLAPGDEVDVIDLAGGSVDVFDRAIERYDRQILIGLLGAYLHVLEGQTPGGRGDTREHRGVSELAQWHLSAFVGSVLTDQLGPILVDENFLGAGYPVWKLSAIDVSDVTADLAIDEKLHAIGVPLSKAELLERAGRKPPQDDDDAVAGAGAVPAAPAGGLGFPFGDGGDGEDWEVEVEAPGGTP